MAGLKPLGINWNVGGFGWMSGDTFLLWKWLSTVWRLSLHSLRYLKAVWTRSWAAGSRWHCLSRGVEQVSLQWSLSVWGFFKVCLNVCIPGPISLKISLPYIRSQGLGFLKSSLVIEEDMQYQSSFLCPLSPGSLAPFSIRLPPCLVFSSFSSWCTCRSHAYCCSCTLSLARLSSNGL